MPSRTSSLVASGSSETATKVYGPGRTVLLHKPYDGVQHHHRKDHDGVRAVAQEYRECAGAQEHVHQRIVYLTPEDPRDSAPRVPRQDVGSRFLQPLFCLGGVQTLLGGYA